LKGIQGHQNCYYHFKIYQVAVCRKSQIFLPGVFGAPVNLTHWKFIEIFGIRKPQLMGYHGAFCVCVWYV